MKIYRWSCFTSFLILLPTILTPLFAGDANEKKKGKDKEILTIESFGSKTVCPQNIKRKGERARTGKSYDGQHNKKTGKLEITKVEQGQRLTKEDDHTLTESDDE